MKLKGIELEGTYKIVCYATNLVVYDEKGKEIYREYSDGYWAKWEYNEKGKMIYYEDSNGYWVRKKYNEKDNQSYSEDSDGYWFKIEYNEKGEQIYYEDSEGISIDERVKELTIEEIEKSLGYKIKIKGE